MTINCNVTGSERKRLAQALGAILLWEPVYQGAPSFDYAVGNYTVDRNGTISCPDSATPEIVAQIISKLTDEGFTSEVFEEDAPAEVPAEMPDVAPEAEAQAIPEVEATEADVGGETPDAAAEPEASLLAEASAANTADGEPKLTISIPRGKLPDDALARLRTMVSNKEVLFKRALLADALPIEVSETEVSFPWFTLTGMEGEAAAYTLFITYLCKMAAEQTRVLDKPYDGDNDRFAMRIFMVRLGMKGAQFALARKLMMQHLTGNSGWRYGIPPKKVEEAEIPAPDALPDTETAEDYVPPATEEVSDAVVEDSSPDSEPVPDEVSLDSAEGESSGETVEDDAVTSDDTTVEEG